MSSARHAPAVQAPAAQRPGGADPLANLRDAVRLRLHRVSAAEEHHGDGRAHDAGIGLEPVSDQLDRGGFCHRLRLVPASRRHLRPTAGRAPHLRHHRSRRVPGDGCHAPRTLLVDGSRFVRRAAPPAAAAGVLTGRGLSGVRRRVRGLVSAAPLGFRAGTADHGVGPGRGVHPAAHQPSHVGVGVAAGAAVGEPAGRPADRDMGLVRAQCAARTSVRIRGRARRDRGAGHCVGRRRDKRQAGREHPDKPQRTAAGDLLPVHELLVLSALQLGVSVLGARAEILRAGNRLAGDFTAARRGLGRGCGRPDHRRIVCSLRQPLGLSSRAAHFAAHRRGAAVGVGECRQPVPRGGGACLLFRGRRAQ